MATERRKILWGLLLASACLIGTPARAGSRGLHLAATGMLLGSSARQGGQGPSGMSFLTHSDLVYHFWHVGIGAFAQFDFQGSAQKDFGYGPKFEIHVGPFYSELGWATVKRSYTDRSIAEDTGTGWIVGFGVRFGAGGGRSSAGTAQGGGQGGGTPSRSPAKEKGWFFQAVYRYRTQHITKQDGLPLGETITQTDGYPTLGFGYLF